MVFGDDSLMQVYKTDSSSIDFSIVLISYKHDDFFSDALNSIINQIYDKTKLELIVVCKSSGKPIDIIKGIRFDFDVKLVIDDGFSQGPKYEAAFQMARHDWIALLDDDDMWRPDKLKVLSNLIAKNDELVYIHNSKKLINKEFHFNNIYGRNLKKEANNDLKKTNKTKINSINCMHNGSSITFKKQIVSNYKYIFGNLPGAVDFFLFASARMFEGKLFCLDEELTYFRVEQKNYKFRKTHIVNNLTRQLESYYIIENMIQNDSKLSILLQKEIISNQMKLIILGNLKCSRHESFIIIEKITHLKITLDKNFLLLDLLFGIRFVNRKFAKYIYELVSSSHFFA